ncbi:MAG: major capsid protein [Candidatus Thiodiazotropha endolucinida]|nr:major capsid protein [Candidatus Thiodiazotropha taylori]MCW4321592.1 major capsid protein [Candidatus Thiodiazotropha taylori]
MPISSQITQKPSSLNESGFLSNMVVFDKQVQLVATEVLDQKLSFFNEAALNTISMIDETHIGDYIQEASYKFINGLIQRRDAYSDDEVEALFIEQIEDISVKVDGRVGPVRWSGEQFRRLGQSSEEAGLVIGTQAALGILQDMLNTTASAMVAALEGQQKAAKADPTGETISLVLDRSTASISLLGLNSAKSLMGDRSSNIIVWLMHSKVWHDLIGSAITNAERLFKIETISVMEVGFLGARFVVSDIPVLFDRKLVQG